MLSFYYGAMGSGKTEEAINIINNASYKYDVFSIVVSPSYSFEVGDKQHRISSRNGMSVIADAALYKDCEVLEILKKADKFKHVVVDEVQFMSIEQIRDLAFTSKDYENVFCFGLLHDFKGNIFSSSYELMKHTDMNMQLHCDCALCDDEFGTLPLRSWNGEYIFDGKLIMQGKSCYVSVCQRCYNKEAAKAGYDRFA